VKYQARILFIYPNINSQEGFNHGIAALSGALKDIGAETRLINLNNSLYDLPTTEELLAEIRRFDPDLICFSVMSQQYKYALTLAREIKKKYSFPLAIGGVHAAMDPEGIAADRIFDFIAIGECDVSLPRLVAAMKEDADVTAVQGIWAFRDGEYKRNALGPFPSLESLPPKDFEIFDLDHMLDRMNGWMSLLTSRGCPFRCSYCFNHEIVNRYRTEAGVKPAAYLRRYPLERVLGEAGDLAARHPGIRTFIFDDDLFTLDEKTVLDFCRGYRELGLGIPFVVNAHVQSFTRDMAEALKEAGCMIVKFGIESGSERIRRDVLHRIMSNAQIVDAFAMAEEAGLHTSAFLMIGLPLEEREDLEATIDLVARVRPGRFRWSVFFPFPGTEIKKICDRHNLVDRSLMEGKDTFYEGSVLRFEPGLSLFIEKLRRCFHWYVNGRAGFGLEGTYGRLAADLEALDAEAWAAHSGKILEEDRRLSDRFCTEGKLHYSIRYTQVMAVRSDFEEANQGFSGPAKQWGGATRTETP